MSYLKLTAYERNCWKQTHSRLTVWHCIRLCNDNGGSIICSPVTTENHTTHLLQQSLHCQYVWMIRLCTFLLMIAPWKTIPVVWEENLTIKVQKAPKSKHFQDFRVYKCKHISGTWLICQNLLNILKLKQSSNPFQ
jgi:hypothetical protein